MFSCHDKLQNDRDLAVQRKGGKKDVGLHALPLGQ